MRYRSAQMAALVLLVASASGCSKPVKKTSVVESREASSVGLTKVEVRNTTGKIDIVATRSLNPRFKVTANKFASAPGSDKSKAAVKKVKLKIYRSGPTAIVVVKHPTDSGRTRYGADLRVFLPAELEVDVDNRKGDVRVLGMTGRVQVRVTHGAIEARGLAGHIKAYSQRGDVTASGQVGSCDLRADRGDIKLYVRNRDQLQEASSVRTTKGNIRVVLSSRHNGDFTAKAGKGKVTADLPGLKTVNGTRVATLGKGGKLLALETYQGNILVLTRTYGKTRYMPHSGAEGTRVHREKHQGHRHAHPMGRPARPRPIDPPRHP